MSPAVAGETSPGAVELAVVGLPVLACGVYIDLVPALWSVQLGLALVFLVAWLLCAVLAVRREVRKTRSGRVVRLALAGIGVVIAMFAAIAVWDRTPGGETRKVKLQEQLGGLSVTVCEVPGWTGRSSVVFTHTGVLMSERARVEGRLVDHGLSDDRLQLVFRSQMGLGRARVVEVDGGTGRVMGP